MGRNEDQGGEGKLQIGARKEESSTSDAPDRRTRRLSLKDTLVVMSRQRRLSLKDTFAVMTQEPEMRDVPQESEVVYENVRRQSVRLHEKYEELEAKRQVQVQLLERKSMKMRNEIQPQNEYEGAGATSATGAVVAAHSMTEDQLLERLLLDIQHQATLSSNDKENFLEQWALLGDVNKEKVENACRAEIKAAKKRASDTLERLRDANTRRIGLEILHTFTLDLLGRDSAHGAVLAAKIDIDFEKRSVVTLRTKSITWFTIIMLNLFMDGFTILRCFERGKHWQTNFLCCWVIQVVLDAFLCNTMECIWVNFALPYLVKGQVHRVLQIVGRAVRVLGRGDDRTELLNIAPFFFASRTLADHFPDLPESTIVRAYTNHLPEGKILHLIHGLRKIGNVPWKERMWLYGVDVSHRLLEILIRFPMELQILALRLIQPLLTAAIINEVSGIKWNISAIAGSVSVVVVILTIAFVRIRRIMKTDTQRVTPILDGDVDGDDAAKMESKAMLRDENEVGQDNEVVDGDNEMEIKSSVQVAVPRLMSRPPPVIIEKLEQQSNCSDEKHDKDGSRGPELSSSTLLSPPHIKSHRSHITAREISMEIASNSDSGSSADLDVYNSAVLHAQLHSFGLASPEESTTRAQRVDDHLPSPMESVRRMPHHTGSDSDSGSSNISIDLDVYNSAVLHAQLHILRLASPNEESTTKTKPHEDPHPSSTDRAMMIHDGDSSDSMSSHFSFLRNSIQRENLHRLVHAAQMEGGAVVMGQEAGAVVAVNEESDSLSGRSEFGLSIEIDMDEIEFITSEVPSDPPSPLLARLPPLRSVEQSPPLPVPLVPTQPLRLATVASSPPVDTILTNGWPARRPPVHEQPRGARGLRESARGVEWGAQTDGTDDGGLVGLDVSSSSSEGVDYSHQRFDSDSDSDDA